MFSSQSQAIELRQRARQLMEDAKNKEMSGDLAASAAMLRKAAEIARKLADCEVIVRDQARLHAKARELESMADKLDKGKRVLGTNSDAGDSVSAEDEYKASVDELIFRAPVMWDDIGGMEEVKRCLKYTLGLILAKPPDGVRLDSASRLLFYGPPGTGKTLLAAACSNMLGATFFNVKASDLLSKYFGESTKLISALFARARSEADTGAALVFIDEVDALCQSRDSQGQTGAELRIVSTLLAELDGMSEKGERPRVITIAATNKPWSIDEAITQRFEKHVYVGLPDEKAREEIFKVHLDGCGFVLSDDVSHSILAERTENYSGRLIKNICKEAVARMVSQQNDAVPRHVDEGTIRGYELAVRPLTREDFMFALNKVRPSTDEVSIRKYKSWIDKVGGDQA